MRVVTTIPLRADETLHVTASDGVTYEFKRTRGGHVAAEIPADAAADLVAYLPNLYHAAATRKAADPAPDADAQAAPAQDAEAQ